MEAARTGRSTAEQIHALRRNIERVVRGKHEAVRLAVTALLARGHLLIEDVPGVGKTTLARSLARSIQGSFRRLQFTSDLLPSDVLGVSIFDPVEREFEFRRGPIFAHVVLADELNRGTPKTQGAMLEAMNEGSVSLDGQTHLLPNPFMVLATQNPIDYHGTFPLPESQLDRFMMRLPLGYPAPAAEREILQAVPGVELVEGLKPVLTTEETAALQDEVESVQVAEPLIDYLLALVTATREDRGFRLGVSPRGAQTLYRAAKALALVDGRDYVVPDDVQALAVPVLAHRILLGEESFGVTPTAAAEAAVRRILAQVPVPV